MDVEIVKMQGLDKLEQIVFKKNTNKKEDKKVQYFIKPDVVIAENGLGTPKLNIKTLLSPGIHAENDEPPI